MKNEKISAQEWIPIEKIYNNGIVKTKNNKYIKIIKIIPINYNLKSNMEKEAILNSYKIFLKTCSFDIQIYIQSSKQNLNKNIENIEENIKKEEKINLNKIAKNYIEYLESKNSEKKSSIKNYYIVISEKHEENEEIIFHNLNEKYFKIKECLFRCGNQVEELEKEKIKKIFNSILNSKKYFNNKK